MMRAEASEHTREQAPSWLLTSVGIWRAQKTSVISVSLLSEESSVKSASKEPHKIVMRIKGKMFVEGLSNGSVEVGFRYLLQKPP